MPVLLEPAFLFATNARMHFIRALVAILNCIHKVKFLL
jgi:hypothetical protein